MYRSLTLVLKSSVSAGNDYLAHANLLQGDFYAGGQAVTNASGIYGTGNWAVLGDPVSNPFDAIFQTKVTPVPEAETYAMLLAGLGLVGGMVARRRKQIGEAQVNCYKQRGPQSRPSLFVAVAVLRCCA